MKHVFSLGIVCFLIFSGWAFIAHGGASHEEPGLGKNATRVLFVGNSLTYLNDLPGLFRDFAKEKGKNVRVEMLAFPNYSLADHWASGALQRKITSGKYSYIIVQQGPSSQAEGRAVLLEYGTKIKTLCSAHKAQLVFFMVWPARQHYHTFGGVINSYSEVARVTESLLCPVGKIWKEHFDATGNFSYYGEDAFHPSPKGSQVAAEIIYQTLFEGR
ncbi:MAG: SGNH/GDSL hydrolase family protein [Saprospiraceae bacterium]|nr:SGNH/GDSL hydrolase family protein [Saprospiraceae bacterium]